jgi:predicted PurR-regulated permease PerM
MNLNDNTIVRALAVMVAVAAGIRVIFWLLTPVMPYLAASLICFAVFRLARWCRNRW